MAIPASELVQITPRVLSGGTGALNFNGLFLTTSEQAQSETLLTFNNATEVAKYFGYDSQHYKAATVYFNGYDNSLTKPSQCFFFKHPNKHTPSFVRGLACDDPNRLLSNIQQSGRGEFTLELGAKTHTIKDLNFSSAKSLSDVAAIVQNAINAVGEDAKVTEWAKATCVYSSLNEAFQLNSGVASDEVNIVKVSGSVADLLGLSPDSGAIYSKGVKSRTYNETLDKVKSHTGNFVTYTTIEEIYKTDEAQALAKWANDNFSKGDQFLYCFFTTDSSLESSPEALKPSMVGTAKVGTAVVSNRKSGSEIVTLFNDKQYQGVCGTYGGVEYAAFIMGITASLDWNQPNSVITYAFKSQAGLSANVSDIDVARRLQEMKLNYIGNYACRNDNFILSAHGYMFGAFNWIDSYINSCWLNNQLQTAILAGFKNIGKVPYNETGYAMIRAWCNKVIDTAIKNGVISTGVEIDDAMRINLERESGSQNICTNLEANGYHLQISSNTDSRYSRGSPSAMMWYADAGAVQKLIMPVTTVQ